MSTDLVAQGSNVASRRRAQRVVGDAHSARAALRQQLQRRSLRRRRRRLIDSHEHASKFRTQLQPSGGAAAARRREEVQVFTSSLLSFSSIQSPRPCCQRLLSCLLVASCSATTAPHLRIRTPAHTPPPLVPSSARLYYDERSLHLHRRRPTLDPMPRPASLPSLCRSTHKEAGTLNPYPPLANPAHHIEQHRVHLPHTRLFYMALTWMRVAAASF
jgi:hypothetical protein